MNAHAHISAAEGAGADKNRAALLSLAKTQRRLAHHQRAVMAEAERDGDLKTYRTAKAEHARLWAEAKWHLQFARWQTWPVVADVERTAA